jgi:hypothetical protein
MWDTLTKKPLIFFFSRVWGGGGMAPPRPPTLRHCSLSRMFSNVDYLF